MEAPGNGLLTPGNLLSILFRFMLYFDWLIQYTTAQPQKPRRQELPGTLISDAYTKRVKHQKLLIDFSLCPTVHLPKPFDLQILVPHAFRVSLSCEAYGNDVWSSSR